MWRRTSSTWPSRGELPRADRRRPGGDARGNRRLLGRGAVRGPAGRRATRAGARAGARDVGAGAERLFRVAGGRERARRRRALVPRRGHVRPLRPRDCGRRPAARRIPDRLHAVSARAQPGRAAGDLRVPDRDLRAHRHGRLERVRLRRDDGRRRRLFHRQARDRPHEGGRHRGDQPAGAPGGQDLRARLRARGCRGPAQGRSDRPGRTARGRGGRRLRDLPAPELLRRARARARPCRGRERRRGAGGRPRRPALAGRARGAGELRLRARDRRGAVGGELPLLRGAALRIPRSALRLHPAHARTDRGRDDRRRGQPRLCAHPPDARAAHQAREGDLKHHHQPDAPGAGRARLPLVARAGGAQGAGGDLHGPFRARAGAARAPASVCRSANIQGVCRAPRTARAGGHPRRMRAGRAPRLRGRARLPCDGRRAARRADREAHAGRDRAAGGGARGVKLIYEKSHPGRRAGRPPRPEGLAPPEVPSELSPADPPRLPELAEPDLMRHFTELSTRNFGIDTGFYPLGSCTMKHNPRINERLAALPGFRALHPHQEPEGAQGALRLCWELQEVLAEVTGLDAVSLQPAAGSQGELTGLMLMRAYFDERGEDEQRRKIVIPDTAHGTNPASVTMAGYELTPVKTAPRGNIDVEDLRGRVDEHTAGRMLTNPSTLGLFDENIEEIASIFHGAGALMYYDGANLNAVCGISRPGDMGFDIVHINLHKTFSQPHGGGGPGGGPIVVAKRLEPLPPPPAIVREGDRYGFDYDRPQTIGKVRGFYGPFGVFVRSYAFILAYGPQLREMSEVAVLNANYLLARLREAYELPYNRLCMHEFVLSARPLKREHGVTALDVAKRLMDYGFHPPTIYFPLVVPEALMIEPTETEAKETLDAFADAMIAIAREAADSPELLHDAPHSRPVHRLDEVRAAKQQVVRYRFEDHPEEQGAGDRQLEAQKGA